MEALFLKILNMSITASYVILAVMLICLLLKKTPKKYSYLLWSVVLFRLICPISFSSVFSIFQAKPFDMTTAQKGGGATLSFIPADIGYMDTPRVTVGIPTMNSIISESLPTATPYASVNPMQILMLLGTILWCTGITVLLVYSIVTYIRLKCRMTTAVRLEGNVFESDKIRSPFILGFVRPRIYIPFGLGEQERAYVLQHERCHLKRKDHLIKPLSFCVLTIHWFNPLVWLAFVLMTKDMEMSCDEKVLSENGADNVHEYSTSLLSFAANRRFPAASPLAFGETDIRGRVKNVLRFRNPKKWVIILTVILCVAVIISCAANPMENKGAKAWNIYKITRFDGEIPMKTTISGTQDGVEDFLSLQQDFMLEYDTDTCYNITPDYIQENSDYLIFKYDTSCASFLLYKGKVYPLGEWFGGLGVTNMALADLDGDQKPELYFTYSWGSGLHRSHAAYFDPYAKKVVIFDYTHWNKDMIITENNDGGLSLYNATINKMDSFVNFEIERTNFITDVVYENGQISLNPVANK